MPWAGSFAVQSASVLSPHWPSAHLPQPCGLGLEMEGCVPIGFPKVNWVVHSELWGQTLGEHLSLFAQAVGFAGMWDFSFQKLGQSWVLGQTGGWHPSRHLHDKFTEWLVRLMFQMKFHAYSWAGTLTHVCQTARLKLMWIFYKKLTL